MAWGEQHVTFEALDRTRHAHARVFASIRVEDDDGTARCLVSQFCTKGAVSNPYAAACVVVVVSLPTYAAAAAVRARVAV